MHEGVCRLPACTLLYLRTNASDAPAFAARPRQTSPSGYALAGSSLPWQMVKWQCPGFTGDEQPEECTFDFPVKGTLPWDKDGRPTAVAGA